MPVCNVNGKDLHKINLIIEDSVISALHILPQVKDGRSSNGHLMINTGILPLQSGAAATT